MSSYDSRRDLRSRIARGGFATLILIGLMAMALIAAGCGGDEGDTGAGSGATAAETAATGEESAEEKANGEETSDAKGKEMFTTTCGGCHTLADAGTSGTTGPDLDDVKPDVARVEAAIQNGGTTGNTMPKDLYKGEEATEVAEYVASVAGK